LGSERAATQTSLDLIRTTDASWRIVFEHTMIRALNTWKKKGPHDTIRGKASIGIPGEIIRWAAALQNAERNAFN